MRALEEIVALTESVESHVERGDWAEAGALDARRCTLLAALFADPATAGTLATHRGVLQDLLLRNQRTLQQVRLCQEQLTQASAALTQAHGALRAYTRADTAHHPNHYSNDNLVYLRDSRMALP